MIEKLIILQQYLRTKYRRIPNNREAFERWQEKQVIDQIRYVRKHSDFYRKQWEGLLDEEWRSFPLIDKTIMMDHFDLLNTLGITKAKAFSVADQAEQSRDFSPMIGSTTVGLSSGTSGNRGIFLVSQQERRAWTGTILAKALPHSIFKKEKIAFFLRANSNLYASVKSKQIEFLFYDLLEPVRDHLQRLNEQLPGVLVAPPSMLRMLAEAQLNRKLHIAPHKVIAVAEVLDPIDKRMIEQAFKQTVHQIYQCTEGFLASTCAYGTLHLNEDIVAIQKEYISENERKFMPIITDFSRSAQPIIRYRLNDVLTEKETPCPCGSPMLAIEGIDGRADDVFYFEALDQHELRPVFSDFISRSIMHASPEIKAYYAVQHAVDKVTISYRLQENPSVTSMKQLEEKVSGNIQSLCKKIQCKMPFIDFRLMEMGIEDVYPTDVKATEVRKLRRIERRFDIHGRN